ncbi:MAG: hypothetical protein R3308_07770, partial [Thiohalobacterales bacterium]|nr:hypothetical protein [Thiohalobacterales bacterium]
ILQAVVMSDHSEIDVSDLHLGTSAANTPVATSGTVTPQPGMAAMPPPEDAAAVPADTETYDNPWTALRMALKSQVRIALEYNNAPVPLGRWLDEDLVLTADRVANGTASRASAVLGMAETTFRRRLEKVKREYEAGLLSRTGDWSAIQPVLSSLIQTDSKPNGANIFERARRTLLEEVMTRVRQNGVLGSALMGVTAPTYRRWTEKLTG